MVLRAEVFEIAGAVPPIPDVVGGARWAADCKSGDVGFCERTRTPGLA